MVKNLKFNSHEVGTQEDTSHRDLVAGNRRFAGLSRDHVMTMSITKIGCSTKWLPEMERAR